jgi:hypothetical protein
VGTALELLITLSNIAQTVELVKRNRLAQIDHLIIDRVLTTWVCESKHFSEGA